MVKTILIAVTVAVIASVLTAIAVDEIHRNGIYKFTRL